MNKKTIGTLAMVAGGMIQAGAFWGLWLSYRALDKKCKRYRNTANMVSAAAKEAVKNLESVETVDELDDLDRIHAIASCHFIERSIDKLD